MLYSKSFFFYLMIGLIFTVSYNGFAQVVSKKPSPKTVQNNQTEKKIEKEGSLLLESLALRDPFQPPIFKKAIVATQIIQDHRPLTPLEKFSLQSLKLKGIMTGPGPVTAIVLAPDGQTYLVNSHSKIGNRRGIVDRITSEGIYVKEQVLGAAADSGSVEHVLRFENQHSILGYSVQEKKDQLTGKKITGPKTNQSQKYDQNENQTSQDVAGSVAKKIKNIKQSRKDYYNQVDYYADQTF